MTLEDSGVRALGKVSEEVKLRELARRRRALRAVAGRRELRDGADRGVRRGDAGRGLRHPRLPRRPARRRRRPAGAPGDALALAEALRRMALEPAMRARMARAARERAERFAWPHVAAEVAETYEQAIATARRATAPPRGARARGPPLRPRALGPAAARPGPAPGEPAGSAARRPPRGDPAAGPRRMRRCAGPPSRSARWPARASRRSPCSGSASPGWRPRWSPPSPVSWPRASR